MYLFQDVLHYVLASTLPQSMFSLRCTVGHTSRVTARSQVSSGIALPSVHPRTDNYSLSLLADKWNSLPALFRSITFFSIIQAAAPAAAGVSSKETSVCWITLME